MSIQFSKFSSKRHNHARCMSTALKQAEKLCSQRRTRLTAIRRRVLELIWTGHEPVLAYDLLERFRDEKRRAAPPTIYRALEFLLENKLIHRIESLNAFVGCVEPGKDHNGQFLICTDCRLVAELDDTDIGKLIQTHARAAGFSINQQIIEVQGQCTNCAGRVQKRSASHAKSG